jgi:hypothetical protein
LFWNGQAFGESALQPVGKYRAAQIRYTAASEIDCTALRRWLKNAGKDVFDYHGGKAASKASRTKAKN